MNRVPLVVTIDAEGDDGWSLPEVAETRNARFVPRFQELCERYGLKPTYLTNFEMANDAFFVEFGRDAAKRGVAEIGMHLHAWNTPPTDVTLTDADYRHAAYLIEYPFSVMREKVRTMTEVLTEAFGERPVSHRAGRWVVDSDYVRILVDEGYLVDCSVTPHESWAHHPRALPSTRASDYRLFPETPYFVDPARIDRAGDSPLLEVPMTVVARGPAIGDRIPQAVLDRRYPRAAVNRLFPRDWLRPRGGNRDRMLRIIQTAVERDATHLEFIIHSSELMPGGSPTFPTEQAIEDLYEDLEAIFSAAAASCEGMTLREFRSRYTEPAA